MTTEKSKLHSAGQRSWPLLSALLAFLLGTSLIGGTAMAQGKEQPRRLPVWYEGTTVTSLLLSEGPIGVLEPGALPEHVAQPFYRILSAGVGAVQAPVIGVVPGDIGYTGWWRASIVLDFSGRDHETDPYTSVGEVGSALCAIPGFPGNIQACMANGTPLIDITGFGQTSSILLNIPIVMSAPPPQACD